MEKLKAILFDLFDQYEEADDIVKSLRSLNSCNDINDNEYDTIMANYEQWLQEYEKNK